MSRLRRPRRLLSHDELLAEKNRIESDLGELVEETIRPPDYGDADTKMLRPVIVGKRNELEKIKRLLSRKEK